MRNTSKNISTATVQNDMVEIKDTSKENMISNIPHFRENAAWWRRLIGWIIDVLPLLILAMATALEYRDPRLQQFYFVWFYILYYTSYCIILEGIFSCTLGKLMTGTIVLDSETFDKPPFGQILVRSFARHIPFDIFSFIALKPRGWHDSISNTMVTTVKSRNLDKNGSVEIDLESGNNFQKRMNKLKKSKKGVYRLIITLSIILPLIISTIAESLARYSYGETFLGVLVLTLFIYWTIVCIGLWIYEGFEEKN